MISKVTGLGLAPVAMMVALVSPAAAQPAETAEAVLESWVADLDALPEIEATFESIEGSGGSATLTGLSVTGPELIMVFDPISVTDYEAAGDEGFAFGSFATRHIQARTPTTELNVVDFDITGLEVAEPGFVFDPEAPLTSIIDLLGKIETLAMDELSIGRIDIAEFEGGLNAVVSYHDYVINDWSDGRIASSSAGPLIMESPSPDALVVLTVDELRSENIDFTALRRVLDPAAYEDGDREWRTFLGHTEYDNIVVDAPDLRMRIRSIAVDDFEMRQARDPFTPILQRLMTDEQLSSRDADAMMQKILVDLISPWRLGSLSIQGFDIYADDVDRFHIGEFYLSDLSIEGLGEIGLSDIDLVAGGDVDLRIDHVGLGGIVMPDEADIDRLIQMVAAGEEPTGELSLIPAVGFVEANNIELSADGMLPIELEQMLVSADGYVGMVPTGNIIAFRGLTIPLTFLEGEARQLIGQLGYTMLTVDFGMETSWDEAAGVLRLSNIHLVAEDAGSITASMELGGVTRAFMVDPESLSEEELMAMTFNGARLEVVDEAVADRLFAFTAEGTDTPVEQYRDEFIRGLPFLLGMSMDRAIAAEISPAIQEFLRQPSELIVSVEPEEPITFGELVEFADSASSPFALIDYLGAVLSVEPLQ